MREHRYRRYRCPACQTRFSTGEFIVAIGNRTGGHPVEKWLNKLRTEGGVQLIAKLDAFLSPWRQHGQARTVEDDRRIPGAIQADSTEAPTEHGAGGSRDTP